jgi:hypothetical protein
MLNKFLPRVLLGLCIVTAFSVTNRANARTPLTQAEIQELRNMVQLIPKNNSQTRPARRLDTITLVMVYLLVVLPLQICALMMVL